MRALGWIFLGFAIAAAFAGRDDDIRYFTLLGSIHLIGANIIRAIQKGAE